MNQQRSTDLLIYCGPKPHQTVYLREHIMQQVDIVKEVYEMIKLTYRFSMRAEWLNRKGWEACRRQLLGICSLSTLLVLVRFAVMDCNSPQEALEEIVNSSQTDWGERTPAMVQSEEKIQNCDRTPLRMSWMVAHLSNHLPFSTLSVIVFVCSNSETELLLNCWWAI